MDIRSRGDPDKSVLALQPHPLARTRSPQFLDHKVIGARSCGAAGSDGIHSVGPDLAASRAVGRSFVPLLRIVFLIFSRYK